MRFAPLLLDWYSTHARELPWRVRPTPYAVWVSEVMLQQTRVETVIPYFENWMVLFPSIYAVASASQQQILSAWEGLGYYSRARNFHNAAKLIVSDFNGKLPETFDELISLPGIGTYTAAAIASIAFGKDQAAVDGNVRRVLARVFNVDKPLHFHESVKIFQSIATENLPQGSAADYNQALMDLGATVCTKRSPKCDICPAILLCKSFQLGNQADRPVSIPKSAVPLKTFVAAVIQWKEKVLITRRPEKGLLGGMWQFPEGQICTGNDLPECIRRRIYDTLGMRIHVNEKFGEYKHAYTHYHITVFAFLCEPAAGHFEYPTDGVRSTWVKPNDLETYPMGKVSRQIANNLNSRKIH